MALKFTHRNSPRVEILTRDGKVLYSIGVENMLWIKAYQTGNLVPVPGAYVVRFISADGSRTVDEIMTIVERDEEGWPV